MEEAMEGLGGRPCQDPYRVSWSGVVENLQALEGPEKARSLRANLHQRVHSANPAPCLGKPLRVCTRCKDITKTRST